MPLAGAKNKFEYWLISVLPAIIAVAFVLPACIVPAAAASITYVQGNYATPQSSQTAVSVPYTSGQGAGDLNVVVVGWNDTTATVSSVTDKSGNTYALAIGPTKYSGYLSQSIYYAKNISAAAAGANAVTVKFSTAAAYPDIRILEYSGADSNKPVDIATGSSGSSTTSSSGSATTTNATDLILGANIVFTGTTGAGSGFTQRLLTSPDGDIAEDKMVTATGSYSATAPLSSSGPWVMQMIALRTPVGVVQPPTAPGSLTATAASASQINLSWTASTSSVGIAKYIVERCVGAGCTSFTQVATPTGTSYSDTGLTSSTSYSYELKAVDVDGNQSGNSNKATATTLAATVPTTVTYLQGNYATPQSSQTTVTIPFTKAQTAGDLDVVVVGWNDSTATVASVKDKSGNSYALAVGPTLVSGTLSQSIYYAKNIAAAAAGANSVTVTFSSAAAYPDIRILEYSGADPNNPVDVTAGSRGSNTASSSGSATTTNATDLILGANIVFTGTTGAASGFTQRLLTSPDGDIAEDKMVTATGSYSATAPLSSSGPWIMQMVAFRTPSSGLAGNTGSVSVSPTSLAFGNVAAGSSATKSLTLSNTGTGSITISQAGVTGSGFNISGLSLPLSLTAGQSVSFSAIFSPTTAGNFSGSLTIASSASDPTVPLSGTGTTQTLSASPSSLSFGDVTVNTSSTLPVVITNTGNLSVTLSQAAGTGTGFSFTGPALPLTLAAGQNTSFSVTFNPTTAGSVTGSLSVLSNATNSPTAAALSATGANQHTVTLSWTASSSSGITGYNVYRSTVSGQPYTKLNSSLIATTTYTDPTVQAGSTYYYVTTAVDSQGVESADSNQAVAAIPSP